MEHWEQLLERWKGAGLIDQSAVERISEFETHAETPIGRTQEWPVLIALIFGGIAMGAGLLLLVASHWSSFSPSMRFAAVVAMVVVLHLGGIVAVDSARFRSTFHLLGSIALGSAIFLTGQIFELHEPWGHGVSLWTLGTVASWWLLQDAPQAFLLAILTPLAIAGEVSSVFPQSEWMSRWYAAWGTMVALNYLSAARPGFETSHRESLLWVGGVGLIPSAFFLAVARQSVPALPALLATSMSLVLAWWLRREASWINAVFILWAALLSLIPKSGMGGIADMLVYVLCAGASAGFVWWGLREARAERVNFGVAGFAITVLSFYVSGVLDNVGRSEGLIGLGALLLAGGWFLERTRRRLIAEL